MSNNPGSSSNSKPDANAGAVDIARADVIVAGAGPVGLVAALVLAEAGVKVLLLEKRGSLNTASKASTFHPATLEILDTLGLLDQILQQGEIVRRIQYRTPDGPFAEFALSALASLTNYPFRLHLEQARITPLILARLQAIPNATVLFDAEVEAVEQAPAGVVVKARRSGAPADFSAAYLIAADGARSQVRQALAIDFDGVVYQNKILRVMTTDDLDKVLPDIAPVTYLFNGQKSISFLKMPDCWRIIYRVPNEIDEALALSDDWLRARFAEVLPGWTTLPGIIDRDIYSVSRRVASRYFTGRIFLAGDSAHITNTRGGMNMNCGIHDGFAIAKAMVHALKEQNPALVEAAAFERKRVAEDLLIPRTDRNVMAGAEWLSHVREVAHSSSASAEFLASAAMLDMLQRPAVAA